MRRKDIKQTILEYYFVHPSLKARVREIERLLQLPLPSVIRYCKELQEEEMLTIERISNVKLYKASKSPIFLLEKKLYNVKMLYKSTFVETIRRECSNPPIILFGSYAKGEDDENSDIDVYIETSSKKKIDLKSFKKELQRDIQIFKFKHIKDIQNKHLANNIINGIPLNKYVEVFV